jgi:hypothetical protein
MEPGSLDLRDHDVQPAQASNASEAEECQGHLLAGHADEVLAPHLLEDREQHIGRSSLQQRLQHPRPFGATHHRQQLPCVKTNRNPAPSER